MHYSPSARAFLMKGLHTLPADAVPISDDEHKRLLSAQAEGKMIEPGAGGKPRAVAPTVDLATRRLQVIVATKREAARRIDEIAPIWRQLNDIADLARSIPPRQSPHVEIFARRDAIDAVRAASDRLEATIAGMSLRQLAALDIAADHHWPKGVSA